MRKITLLLSLLLAVTAVAQITTPKVPTESEKTFYKFKITAYNNLNNNNYIIADEGNTEKPFRGRAANENETKPEAIFTFEAVEDEEGVYYIYSEDYGAYLSYTEAYLSYTGTGKKEDEYGGKPVTYSKDKSITEKWKLIPHDTNKTNVAIVIYTDKDETDGGSRYGLNVSGDPYGSIVLWKTGNTNYASFFQIEEVDSETVAADITARIDNVVQNLEKCGKQLVGYPTSTSSEVQEALTTAQQNSNLADAKALQRAFNDFWNNTKISDIKLPEDGKVYRIKNYIKTVTGNGQQEHYIQNDNGNVAFPTTDTGDNTTHWVCQQTNDGNSGANRTYASILGNTTLAWKGFGETATVYQMKKGTEFGCLQLYNNDESSHLAVTNEQWGNSPTDFNMSGSGDAQDQNWSTDFIFEEVENADMDKTITLTLGYDREEKLSGEKSYYGTLYMPFAVTLPDGVKAYKVKATEDWTILDEVEITLDDNILPAASPVLLKSKAESGTSEKTKPFNLSIAPAKCKTPATSENELRGRCSDGPTENGTAYILALSKETEDDREVKFFRLNGNEVNGNKAYYLIPTASGASLATIALAGSNRVTAIENAATTTTDGAAACYDLSGRQVTKPAAGLYIVGGKKVFVK